MEEDAVLYMVDHGWKSVVVSVRGALSLENCVVDVLLDAQPLGELGREYGFDGKGEIFHYGILGVARNILKDATQVLSEEDLSGSTGRGNLVLWGIYNLAARNGVQVLCYLLCAGLRPRPAAFGG